MNNSLVLSSGSSQRRSQTSGRRKSSGRKSVPRQFQRFGGGEDIQGESAAKNTSHRSSVVEDLSSVLDQISLKDKNGSLSRDGFSLQENQYERKPKDLILNIRKRLIKKSTIVDVESDSESESFASVEPAAASPSADYTSADDGDVDSPVISKVKSKTKQVAPLPKPFPSLTSQLPRSSDAEDETTFAPEATNGPRGIASSLSSVWF